MQYFVQPEVVCYCLQEQNLMAYIDQSSPNLFGFQQPTYMQRRNMNNNQSIFITLNLKASTGKNKSYRNDPKLQFTRDCQTEQIKRNQSIFITCPFSYSLGWCAIACKNKITLP